MKLPLVGKIDRPLPWVVGSIAAGTVLVGVIGTALVNTTSPQYDLEALTVPVREEDLRVKIRASGTVLPVQSVNISPKNSGRLVELFVEQGDRVEAGDKLAQMEYDEFSAQVERAKANLAEAVARLEEGQNGTRREDIIQARARVSAAQSRLERALARIPQEIQQSRAQVEAAQSRYDLARARVDRNRELVEQGAISRDRFDEVAEELRSASAALTEAQRRYQQAQDTNRPEIATLEAEVAEAKAALQAAEQGPRTEEIARLEAAVRAARADLMSAEINLRDTTIVAPFSGTVTQRYADIGAFVTPTTSASSTASATSTSVLALARELEVIAKVPEVDVGQLEPGQSVEIMADAYPNRSFPGEVILIAPEAVVEQNVTSFEVRVKILEGLERLKSGMNVDVIFLGDRLEDTIVVPTVAIVTQEGQTGVMIPNERDRPEFRPVTLGLTIDNQTQILEGIDSGDRVFIDLPEERGLGRD